MAGGTGGGSMGTLRDDQNLRISVSMLVIEDQYEGGRRGRLILRRFCFGFRNSFISRMAVVSFCAAALMDL